MIDATGIAAIMTSVGVIFGAVTTYLIKKPSKHEKEIAKEKWVVQGAHEIYNMVKNELDIAKKALKQADIRIKELEELLDSEEETRTELIRENKSLKKRIVELENQR